MARNTLNTEIRSRIEAFLGEVSTMFKQAALESVRAALGDSAAPARRGPGRRPAQAKTGRRVGRPKSRGGKRSSEQVDQMATRVLAYVKSNPGQGLEAIGKHLGIATKELKLPVIKLLSARQLKKSGQKRGTKYFAGGKAGSARKVGKKVRRKAARGKAKRGKAKKRARKARVIALAA